MVANPEKTELMLPPPTNGAVKTPFPLVPPVLQVRPRAVSPVLFESCAALIAGNWSKIEEGTVIPPVPAVVIQTNDAPLNSLPLL